MYCISNNQLFRHSIWNSIWRHSSLLSHVTSRLRFFSISFTRGRYGSVWNISSALVQCNLLTALARWQCTCLRPLPVEQLVCLRLYGSIRLYALTHLVLYCHIKSCVRIRMMICPVRQGVIFITGLGIAGQVTSCWQFRYALMHWDTEERRRFCLLYTSDAADE